MHAASFPSHDEADLVDALRRDGDLFVSLVAEEDGVVVGHVAFSPVTLAAVEGSAVEGGVGLAPVAVVASHRRRGVAERLIRDGIAACHAKGARFVVVLGSPAYYGRFGFVAARRFQLEDAYGGGDAFQALEREAGVLEGGGGLVAYARAFGALG